MQRHLCLLRHCLEDNECHFLGSVCNSKSTLWWVFSCMYTFKRNMLHLMLGPLNIKYISNTAITPILLFTITLRFFPLIVCHMGFILFMSSVFVTHMAAYIHFQTDETASQEGPWLCRKCMLQNSSSLDKASRSVTRTWWETRGINRQESSEILDCHRDFDITDQPQSV